MFFLLTSPLHFSPCLSFFRAIFELLRGIVPPPLCILSSGREGMGGMWKVGGRGESERMVGGARGKLRGGGGWWGTAWEGVGSRGGRGMGKLGGCRVRGVRGVGAMGKLGDGETRGKLGWEAGGVGGSRHVGDNFGEGTNVEGLTPLMDVKGS